MDYKVGDQVRITSNQFGEAMLLGTIIIINATRRLYTVKASDDGPWPYYVTEFEPSNSYKIRQRLGIK